MEIASTCPMPVGVVRWSLADGDGTDPGGVASRPVLTVVVKGTYALDRDGELALAPDQDPLSLDRALELPGFRGLAHASDLVPYKPRADVMLAGHARAGAPAEALPLRLALGDLDKRFFALAAAPTARVPLVPVYLRGTPSALGERVTVGPCPAWADRVPTVPDLSGDLRLLGADGEPLGPLPMSFDYGLFNAAPADQQLAELPARGVLEIEGVFARAPRREVRLPSVSPRVFLLGPGGAPPRELPVRADTLWIDADRAVCTVTWRGVTEIGDAGEPSLVVLALGAVGRPLTFDAVVQGLGRARRFRPVDHAALRAAPPPSGVAHGSVPPPPVHDVEEIDVLEELDEEPTADSTFDELMADNDEPDTVVTAVPPELLEEAPARPPRKR
jgi:hypothetical protein